MKMRKAIAACAVSLIVSGTLLILAQVGFAQDRGERYPVPDGVFIKLTEDFYRALREQGEQQSTTTRTDASSAYLHQIAVSSRFMVETNLQILKQQETIIRLLQSIDKKKP